MKTGKNTFEISYAQGVLPEPKAKMTRTEKAAAAEQEATAEENAPELY